MDDQKTPAEVAADAIVDDVANDYGMTAAAARRYLVAWSAIIAQATLDACEQAEVRVRAEERRAAYLAMAAECECRPLVGPATRAELSDLAAWARGKAGD